jgi:hypothetical protein
MRRGVVLTLSALLGAAAMAAGAGAAGNAGSTFMFTVDPTGAVFSCPGADYTVLGGTLRFLIHDSIAADGSEHLRSTRVLSGVTLTDGTTTTIYRLIGANAAGGNVNLAGAGKFEFTDVTMFSIVAPNGGVVGRVAGVEHVSPSGSGFSLTFGQCQAPQG